MSASFPFLILPLTLVMLTRNPVSLQVDWIWSAPGLGERFEDTKPLRIAYLLPHHNVTGGMKMLLRQMSELRERGHQVVAFFRGPEGSPVLPPWAEMSVDEEVLISPSASLSVCFGYEIDVLMVGYFTQLSELVSSSSCPGPVLYWEQGHEHVFGDPTASLEWDRVFHGSMHIGVPLLSVSSIVRDILSAHFSRVAPVIPNAIECDRFYPIASRVVPWIRQPWEPRRILLVGNPALRLKNFDTALQALAETHRRLSRQWVGAGGPSTSIPRHEMGVQSAGDAIAALQIDPDESRFPEPLQTEESFAEVLRALNPSHDPLYARDGVVAAPGIEVTWICQVQPAIPPGSLPFPIRFVVDPSQSDLAQLYRAGFDALLFCSVYEAWGMPVLEAMASGVPVVTSKCHGVDMFVSHGYNAFLAGPYDTDGLARNLAHIVTNGEVAKTLARRGRKIALRFRWDTAISALESALYQVQHYLSDPAKPSCLTSSLSRSRPLLPSTPSPTSSTPPTPSSPVMPGSVSSAASSAASTVASIRLPDSADPSEALQFARIASKRLLSTIHPPPPRLLAPGASSATARRAHSPTPLHATSTSPHPPSTYPSSSSSSSSSSSAAAAAAVAAVAPRGAGEDLLDVEHGWDGGGDEEGGHEHGREHGYGHGYGHAMGGGGEEGEGWHPKSHTGPTHHSPRHTPRPHQAPLHADAFIPLPSSDMAAPASSLRVSSWGSGAAATAAKEAMARRAGGKAMEEERERIRKAAPFATGGSRATAATSAYSRSTDGSTSTVTDESVGRSATIDPDLSDVIAHALKVLDDLDEEGINKLKRTALTTAPTLPRHLFLQPEA